MKKAISLLLVIILYFSALPISALAQTTTSEYTDAEKSSIHSKYINNENMLDTLFGSDTSVGYWHMINNTKENDFFKWSLDSASKIIGEYPDKKDYAEILANLIMMQSGDIAEQMQNQSQYDDLKDSIDYVVDIVGIATDFVGDVGLLENIESIIDTATGGVGVIIDNVEQARYYETSIRDYTQSKLFLEAVSKYAENEELCNIASSLLEANSKLLEKRLEYLSNSASTLANYEAEFFVNNMSFALLKTVDFYKTDETIKWYVDCGEKLGKSISTIFSAGNFAFNMTMLAGDIGFGTSDTFNRYQEMKIVSDIANAIVKANSQIIIPQKMDKNSVLTDIQTKCNYYKMLISTHARGEYLIYQLLINDAGLLSNFRILFDYFKEPEDTTDSWYSEQINCMAKYYDILERMFEVSDIEKNIPETHADSIYTWIVEPTIEADDIYYVRNFDVEQKSLNELNIQLMGDYAAFKQNNTLGLVDMDGNKTIIKDCDTIYSFDNHLMLSNPQGLYTLKNKQLVEEYGRGYSYSAYFLNNNHLNSYWAFEEDFGIINDPPSAPTVAVPVCKMPDANKWYSSEQLMTPPYAIYNNDKLSTDFIYEECGTESNGLLAVKENGKWGYVNSKGETIIPIEYDASWNYYSEDMFGYTKKEYCYAASDGYVVLRQDDQWELKDISGNSIIPKGVFEAIRPVYEGKCWVKKNGKWGIIQIDVSKETPKTEDTSIFASMPSEGIFSSGAGGWATNMNLESDGTFTGVYYDSDLGFTGEGYPRGTTRICNFNGKFSKPEKIDDYTYRTELQELMKDGVVGEEYIEDGMKYIYSDAYGLEGGKEFLIYAPGKPISELPEIFLSWVRMIPPVAINDETLSCYGIYSEKLETAFFFYNNNNQSVD